MLKQYANVETAYNMKPEELCAKVSLCDAVIVRSATKVRWCSFGSCCAWPRASRGADSNLAAAALSQRAAEMPHQRPRRALNAPVLDTSMRGTGQLHSAACCMAHMGHAETAAPVSTGGATGMASA